MEWNAIIVVSWLALAVAGMTTSTTTPSSSDKNAHNEVAAHIIKTDYADK